MPYRTLSKVLKNVHWLVFPDFYAYLCICYYMIHSIYIPEKYVMRYFLAILLMLLCYSGVTVSAQALLPEKVPVILNGDHVVEKAKEYIGVPYRAGQMNPKKGFDCSGFTTFVYQTLNISLTHSSRSQYNEGTRVDDCKDLKKGDLVFFTGSRGGTTVGHVGIVTDVDEETGTFQFIHAGRRGICITSSTEAYYSKRYVGACRVLSQV